MKPINLKICHQIKCSYLYENIGYKCKLLNKCKNKYQGIYNGVCPLPKNCIAKKLKLKLKGNYKGFNTCSLCPYKEEEK